jgi:AcrR family transcriptional regulator
MVKTKLTRNDWLAEALEVLSSEGVGGVRVQSLARSLDVTRGSFHWHFNNRDEMLEALLDYWDHEMTEKVIDQINQLEADPEEKIREVAHLVVRTGRNHYDPAVRAWALADPLAREAVQRVDEKRVGVLSGLFREAGFSDEEARDRSGQLAIYLMGEWMVFMGQPMQHRLRLLDRRLDQILDRG